jgi:hypothetical protein
MMPPDGEDFAGRADLELTSATLPKGPPPFWAEPESAGVHGFKLHHVVSRSGEMALNDQSSAWVGLVAVVVISNSVALGLRV